MNRKPLATEAELLSMDSGQKYGRYLYDLETVYQDEIKQLQKVTGGGWTVWQTGGMCCVLGWSFQGADGRWLMCCPEGNLDIDRNGEPTEWYLGWDQEDENGTLGITPNDDEMVGSFADVVARLKKYMKEVK